MTGEKDADATDPEVFSGPATKPSLEKSIEARTSISEVPVTGKDEKSTPGYPLPNLAAAMEKVQYPGLDLKHFNSRG